jgi:hypothetical protein
MGSSYHARGGVRGVVVVVLFGLAGVGIVIYLLMT